MPELTALGRDAGLAAGVLLLGTVAAWAISRQVGWRPAGPIALFIAAPLVPNLDLLGPLSTDDLLPILGLGILATYVSRPVLTRDRLLRMGIAALGLAMLARFATAIVHANDVVGLLPALSVALLRPAFLIAVAVSVAMTVPAARRMRLVAAGLAILGTFEAIFTLVAYLVPTPGIGIRSLRQFENLAGCDYRITGTLGLSPNHIGAVFVVTIPFAIGLAIAAEGRRKWLWIAAASLQGTALFMTFTRASIGLAVIGAIVLLAYHRQVRLFAAAAAMTALLVLGVTWFGCAPDQPATTSPPPASASPRSSTPEQQAGPGSVLVDRLGDSTDRLALWYTAGLMTLDYPSFGVGIGNMVEVMRSNPDRYVDTPYGKSTNSAHNTVLLAGAETGVVGAVATLALNLVLALIALRLLWSKGAVPPLSFAAGIAILGFLAQGMVNNLFTVPATATLLALVVGAYATSHVPDPPAAPT